MNHRWGEPVRFLHKTERSCLRDGCEAVKVSRHEGDEHWVEFWRDGERIDREDGRTPPCEGAA